jgi:hypothetical protein
MILGTALKKVNIYPPFLGAVTASKNDFRGCNCIKEG